MPVVVLPGETKSINCSVYVEGVKSGENEINATIFDMNRKIMTTSKFIVIPQENIVINNYSWNYSGKKEISIPYPNFLYEYYSLQERLDTNDYAAYVFDPYDDKYLMLITSLFESIAEDMDDVSKINLVASFVQNLEYGEDDPLNSSIEYPLYPVEILNNQTCDCEDRSIFVGNILMLMGYNVSLISLPKHMAVGVNLDINLSEYDFYVDEYYYLETIEKNMVLGDVPLLYKSIEDQAVLYSLNSRPILNHDWKKAEGISIDGSLKYVKLKLIVENIGDSIAENIIVNAAFYRTSNDDYNQKMVSISSLQPQEKIQVFLKLNIPIGVKTILKTKLYLNDSLIEENKSSTTFS